MRSEELFMRAVKKVGGTFHAAVLHVGTVESVYDDSCDVAVNAGCTLYDVRLRAIEGSTGNHCTLVPKVGSVAVVCSGRNTPADSFIVQVSELERIDIAMGGQKVVVDNNGIRINGGRLGGMVNIHPLKSWMEAVQADLGVIHGALSSLTGGSVPPVVPFQTPQSLEDNNITH